MLLFDTIVALSTPYMPSAISVIRLSGTKALEIIDKVIFKDSSKLKPNYAFCTNLYHDGKKKYDMIDQVVLTFFKGPNSYTGFDTIEISCHGSPLIVDEIIEVLCKYGARVAEKGEFTYQAFYNNKLSLLQAEKINELIHAKNELSKKLAVRGISQNDDSFVIDIKNKLLKVSANIEYIIEDELGNHDDFVEEMIQICKEKIEPLRDEISKLYVDTKRASQIFSGIKVSFIGEPNVGKSTLLNKLLKEDKAIVTATPGTTRDIVEGEYIYKGIYFKLFDTAGIRETTDLIEQIGIQKSKNIVKNSDIVLYLSDTTFDDNILNTLLKDKLVIKLGTKSDLKLNKESDITISQNDKNLDKIFDLILVKLDLDSIDVNSNHLSKRELSYLKKIIILLDQFIKSCYEEVNLDILGGFIIDCVNIINEMMGLSVGQTKEDVYQSIFSSFCLGK